MNTVVNLREKFDKINEYWSPKVVGEINDTYAKLAKLKGTLAWHKHESEDELFLVVKGKLKIELEDRIVEVAEGEFFIVPKGIAHNPVAEEECEVFMVEKKSTRHTGDIVTEKTKSIEEQLKGI
jgi:mannose-6-phosphate isomerase-like protein (cupin superfamily)